MQFLFVDRIVESVPGEVIRGVKHISYEDNYLTKDAQGKFYFIPSLIGETLGQLAAWNVMQCTNFALRPVAGVVNCVQLWGYAYVGETLLLESYIDTLDTTAVQYHSVARIGEEVVFTIDGALGPLLPSTEFTSLEEVRHQFAKIYHPGDWSLISTKFRPNQGSAINIDLACTTPPMVFDNILSYEVGSSLVAEKRITNASAYFSDHFPLKPVLPMTVLLECKLNLAQEFIRRMALETEHTLTYQVSALRKIKMNEFIVPGDQVLCYVKIKSQTTQELVLTFRSEVDNKRVCVVEMVLTSR